MTLIICPECGRELSDTLQACPHCGYQLSEHGTAIQTPTHASILGEAQEMTQARNNVRTKYSDKTKIRIAVAITAVAVFCSVAGIVKWQFFSPTNQFNRFFQNEQYTEAKNILDTHAENKELQDMANIKIEEFIYSVVDGYNHDLLNDESAKDKLLDITVLSDAATAANVEIDLIKKSKANFAAAEASFNQKKYVEAFEKYAIVYAEDINSDAAKLKIEECKTKYSNEAIIATENLVAAQKHLDAYLYLDKLEKGMVTQIVTAKMTAVKVDAVAEIITHAELLAADGNYNEAINYLKPFSSIDPIIAATISNYEKLIRDNAIATAKSAIILKYDEIEKSYNIVPKGNSTRYANVSYSRNIDPRIRFGNGSASFLLLVGFQQSDWVFTENIVFDCDGNQFNWEIGSFDMDSEVIYGGGIAEWYVALHTPSIAGIVPQAKDLEPLINAMNNATAVKIRFSGNGYKDVLIPKSHIKQLKVLWDVYQALVADPSCIEQLKQ